MNAKVSVCVIYAEAIIYLLIYNLHDCTFNKMCMTYLDVKYFSVVCHSIYCEKLAVKTTLTKMGYFFANKLSYCPSAMICNSIALKCQYLEHR